MKELKAYQNNPQYGPMTIHIRIDGQIIYLKSSNTPQRNQMMTQLRQGGATIEESDAGWLKIDMFAIHTNAKLGTYEVDTEEETQEAIEEKLAKFYHSKYTEANFAVTIIQ